MLVFFLLGASVFASAVLRADLPETAFNETDAPVNLAPPIRPRMEVIPVAVNLIVASPTLPLYCASCVVTSLVLEQAAMPRHRHPHSLQDLLCTFMI
jgi:hypothetical protein